MLLAVSKSTRGTIAASTRACCKITAGALKAQCGTKSSLDALIFWLHTKSRGPWTGVFAWLRAGAKETRSSTEDTFSPGLGEKRTLTAIVSPSGPSWSSLSNVPFLQSPLVTIALPARITFSTEQPRSFPATLTCVTASCVSSAATQSAPSRISTSSLCLEPVVEIEMRMLSPRSTTGSAPAANGPSVHKIVSVPHIGRRQLLPRELLF